MKPPVLTKADMYRRAMAGEFGNILPKWMDVNAWIADPNGQRRYELWGIQSTTKAADPRAKLNVERRDVFPYLVASGLIHDGYAISMMIGAAGHTQWEGDVYDHPTEGLICSGNVNPVGGSWRTHMKKPRLWKRSAAFALLRHVLNENSYDDLMSLRDNYPEHVYELSALDACLGTVPGRNAVIFEVRKY